MDYLRKTVVSTVLSDIFELPPNLLNRKVEIIILPVESDTSVRLGRDVKLGFLDIPPLPESFFDPLPEEDLQAWGL